MQIIDKRKLEPSLFQHLEMGSIFQTEAGTFIKCSIVQSGINAVNLKNGAPSQFILGAVVHPVKAELLIEDADPFEEDFEDTDF